MELIAKTAGAGKTNSAIEYAAAMPGYVIFITTEDHPSRIACEIEKLCPAGKVLVFNVQTAASARALVDGYAAQGVVFETVVLDSNFGVSHADWFKLAQDMENMDKVVVTTQQVMKVRSSKESAPKFTPVIKL